MGRGFLVLIALLVACAPPPDVPRGDVREVLQGYAAPTVGERAEVLRLSYLYLRHLAEGRYSAAYRVHTDDYREQLSFTDWRARVDGDWAARAAPEEVRWRQGLHRFEGPELYAMVHLTGAGPAHALMVWRQGPGGRFRLERIGRR